MKKQAIDRQEMLSELLDEVFSFMQAMPPDDWKAHHFRFLTEWAKLERPYMERKMNALNDEDQQKLIELIRRVDNPGREKDPLDE